MVVKTLQWNIGGGRIRKPEYPADGPYSEDGIQYIEKILKKYNPDIITLQETHADDNVVQAKIIANNLGLSYFENDVYDQSHIVAGQGLGQTIISRHPILEHEFKFFTNPLFEIDNPDGSTWVSHNKGVSRCKINIGYSEALEVVTVHLVPFRRFKIDPLDPKLEYIRSNIAELSVPSVSKYLLQGDFNYDEVSLRNFLPFLFNQAVSEVLLDQPTTPRGRKYDHVIFKGLKHIHSEVVEGALTDHFPIYSEFDL